MRLAYNYFRNTAASVPAESEGFSMGWNFEHKRVLAIHDLSGAGKCSLTVVLPVLSALGCAVSVLPTATLSTHTGGFTNPVYRDLTADMLPWAEHWKREGACFDAIYSGFLGSAAQIEIVREIFSMYRGVNPAMKIVVDPVMGDNGKLYRTYTKEMADGTARLCEKADLITPNMTEAYHLLGEPYRAGPYDQAEILRVLRGLTALGPETVVLTGVWYEETQTGAACYTRGADQMETVLVPKVPGAFHGTGDAFTAALLGALMNGKSLLAAGGCAARFTAECCRSTLADQDYDRRWGISFEKCLPFVMHDILSLEK